MPNIIVSRSRDMPEVHHEFNCDTSRHRLVHVDGTASSWDAYHFISRLDTQGCIWIGTTDYYRDALPMISRLASWCEHAEAIVE